MRSSLRRVIVVRAVGLLLAALSTPLTGQEVAPTPASSLQGSSARRAAAFTIDDALDMRTYSVGDVTKDGRWIAATVSTRRDGLGTNYYRDSDPTYVRTAKAQVLLIDATTGAQRPILPGKESVRNLVWSPDGTKLAMLRMQGDVAFEPVIWDRASGKLTVVKAPAGRYVAENSDLRWLPDGSGLVFSLRTLEWRKAAAAQFARQTTGPIFVQSSADPFLAWDDIRRLSAVRSVAAYDLRTAKVTELVPERRINGYTLSRDGTIMTFTEDLADKTTYDAGPGSGAKLWVKQLPAGEPRVLLPTTRGLNLVWAADGKKYAYSRDGRVYVASVDDTAGRQVAGPPAAAGGPATCFPVVSSTDATKTRPSREYAYFFPSAAQTRPRLRVVGMSTRGSPAGSCFTHTLLPAPGPAS